MNDLVKSDIKIESKCINKNIEFFDCRPLSKIKDTVAYIPQGFAALKMVKNNLVNGLKENDILIIDPSRRIYTDGLIAVFEYKGYVFVRRFGIAFFGFKEIKNKKVYVSGDGKKDYFAYDEINLLGIVVAKQNIFS